MAVTLHQVICANGTFLTSSYEEGGECERLTFAKFVKSDTELDDAAVHPWTAAGGASGFNSSQPPNSLSGRTSLPAAPPSHVGVGSSEEVGSAHRYVLRK